jgi:hypothetical protein
VILTPVRACLTIMAMLHACAPAPVLADQCTTAVLVQAGDTAPCDGQLLPDAWARSLLRCAKVDLPGCRADADLADKLHAARLRQCTADLDATHKALLHCEGLVTAPAAVLPSPLPTPWWQSPVTWGAIGLVVGGAAGLTAAWSLQR